jgi:ankyrin repeat protein
LLEHGADADRRNERGQTPLGGAAFKGYEEIIAALLEHGAVTDRRYNYQRMVQFQSRCSIRGKGRYKRIKGEGGRKHAFY